jgi:polysaccharide export outer membrane protein
MGFPQQEQSRARKLTIAAVLAAAFALSACTPGRGGSVAYDPEGFGAPDPMPALMAAGPQRIGPLDKLRITVFQVGDLTGEFQVDTTGNIDFPLIGTVEAQGRTSAELAEHIGQRLEERYLRNPSVQVAITEAYEHTITVDGAVRDAGVRPVRGTTTLMRAVAMAGGTSQEANPSRVVVFRTINGERMAAAFDLRAIRRAEAEDPIIYGNDIVVVDGDRSRSLFRDIISTIPVLGMFRPY